jgi:hypothetical protein
MQIQNSQTCVMMKIKNNKLKTFRKMFINTKLK